MSSIIQPRLSDSKRCSRCHRLKSLDDFSICPSHRDRKANYCKPCHNAYNKERYLAKKEQINAQNRTYYLKNAEKMREWHRDNYNRNREQYLISFAKYRKGKREYFRAYSRNYYATHKNHMNAQSRKWVRANRDAHRMHWHARRARERQAEGSYTAKEWRALCDWFGGYCLRCGAHSFLTIDHVIPLIKGGANHIGNLQPLCKSCNSIKREQTSDYRDPIQLGAFLASLPR